MTTPNRISLRRTGVLAAAVAAATLAGCATQIENPPRGFTCCNLRSYYGWISSDNEIFDATTIPFGSPAEVTTMKRSYYLYGVIDGGSIGLRDDAAHSEEDTLRWARQVIVPVDPKIKVATWPADVQMAVRNGRVFTGMSKEQVLVSLGYPSRKETRDLSEPKWRYWVSPPGASVDLIFDGDRLARVEGVPPAVQRIEFLR